MPAVKVSPQISMALLFIGFLISNGSGSIGMFMMQLGIILFSLGVAFQIITLPVEFNASKRAIRLLEDNSLLTSAEIIPAKKVLNAAALTYVAAAISSVLSLLRLILISRRRR